MKEIKCPNCGSDLNVVCNSFGSMLNDEQFNAERAGDYYCSTCPDNKRGHSGYAYYWEREVCNESGN